MCRGHNAQIIISRPLGDFLSEIIVFIAFEASYFAVIFRGGIQPIPQGQVMAGWDISQA